MGKLNTKELITCVISIIYIIALLFFPICTGLEETFCGFAWSLTIGGLYFLGIELSSSGGPLFNGERPFTSTHLIIFLVWVISTILMITFKDLEYSTHKILTTICVVYLFSFISTIIMENCIIGIISTRFIKDIKVGDKFYQNMLDTDPILIKSKEHHMRLFIEKIWVVYEKEKFGVKVYDYYFPETKKSLHVSKIKRMIKISYTYTRNKEMIIKECENILKQVQQIYSSEDDLIN